MQNREAAIAAGAEAVPIRVGREVPAAALAVEHRTAEGIIRITHGLAARVAAVEAPVQVAAVEAAVAPVTVAVAAARAATVAEGLTTAAVRAVAVEAGVRVRALARAVAPAARATERAK